MHRSTRPHGQGRAVRRALTLTGPAALLAVLGVAGCAPVQAGAAATVGDQRISTAQLDEGVRNLIRDVRIAGQDAGPSADLNRFELADQVTAKVSEAAATRLGVSVTTTEVDALQRQVMASATTPLEAVLDAAAAQGKPAELREYCRIAALRQRMAARLAPEATGADPAATASRAKKLNDYLAGVATDLKVRINPRYGVWSAKDMLVTAHTDPFVKAAPQAQSGVPTVS